MAAPGRRWRDQALVLALTHRGGVEDASPGRLGQRPVARQCRQLDRTYAGLSGQPAQLAPLMRQDQSDDHAGTAGAGRPTGAVQVFLRPARRVDLEHQADLVDVDAARGDVGGHQHGQRPVLEDGQDPSAGTLGEAAVQGTGEDTRGPQLLGHPIRAALGADEDQGPARTSGDLRGHLGLVLGCDVQQVVSHGADAGRAESTWWVTGSSR